MIIEIIFCVAGTLAFAVIMKAPKRDLIFIAIGSTITAITERLLSLYYGEFAACLIAMICLSFFCEMMARILKEPTTVILMPSTIPLLPGSSIYYTMLYAAQSNTQRFIDSAKSTLYTGLGIALGAVISSIAIRLINYSRKD